MTTIAAAAKNSASFFAPIAAQIWDKKYRLKDVDGTPVDVTVEDTWARIAKALAAVDTDALASESRFMDALSDWKYLPAGRITAGAGTGRDVTLFNCFVMGTIPDSMAGIFDMLKEAALTMQQGGGIGYDFSTLRPKGTLVKGVGSDASGPLSFMDVWDAMCRTIMSAGARRGAMMGTMRCDHPDVLDFISAKRESGRMRNFNLSVLITDAFMDAVKADADWDLVWQGEVIRTVRALEMFNTIMKSTYDFAEPGVIFIDRINTMNPLTYCETISATNPCGEQPLPPYGACLLGSINLAKLIVNPFTAQAKMDYDKLDELVTTSVRMMDNVVDASKFPLPQQAEEARNKRRIGLGVTGLADALLMLRLTYGEEAAVEQTREWMRKIANIAYMASVELAKEKGAFPLFDADKYLASPFIQRLDEEVKAAIREHGIRNALLTSIAPTGTISLYAGNVSSGIEPVFAYSYTRNVLQKDGSKVTEEVVDYAVQMYRDMFGAEAALPDYFVSAQTLSPMAHVRMQAAAQEWVDSSISKTINCPENIGFEEFKEVYLEAYRSGCKGCTTYRPNDITGSVLTATDAPKKEEAPVAAAVVEAPAAAPAPVVEYHAPMVREDDLEGKTYKLKWPGMAHAFYITINDTVDANGNVAPFEIFINTKNVEAQAWISSLTLMISAVFRRGGDVRFVADELKEVRDPRGGVWMKGRYMNSLISAIGYKIEQHMDYLEGKVAAPAAIPAEVKAEEAAEAPIPSLKNHQNGECPECGNSDLVKKEGCLTCLSCGFSKCG